MMKYIRIRVKLSSENDLEYIESILVLNNFNRFFTEIHEDEINLYFYFLNECEMQRVLSIIGKSLDLKSAEKDLVEEKDWLDKFKYEDFMILPGIWIEYVETLNTSKRHENSIRIIPGSAFGTGIHPTTKIAARLIYYHSFDGMDFLDIGCGTGILSVIAHKLKARRITSVDVDELAVHKTIETFKLNDIFAEVLKCDLFECVKDTYDMIVSNIDTYNAIKVICEANKYLKKNGILIISGVPTEKSDLIISSAIKHDFSILDEEMEENWCGFAFKKVKK